MNNLCLHLRGKIQIENRPNMDNPGIKMLQKLTLKTSITTLMMCRNTFKNIIFLQRDQVARWRQRVSDTHDETFTLKMSSSELHKCQNIVVKYNRKLFKRNYRSTVVGMQKL